MAPFQSALENRLCAVKTEVCKENVTTSYKSSPGKQKAKRSDDALSMKEWNVMGTETNTLHILNIDLAIENKHKRNKLNIL